MEKNKTAQKRIDLYNKVVAHIKAKGKGKKNIEGYRRKLERISGHSESMISRMVEKGYMPSLEFLETIERSLPEADKIFQLEVHDSKGGTEIIEG